MKNLIKTIVIVIIFSLNSMVMHGQTASCYLPKNSFFTADTSIVFSSNFVPSALNYRFQISLENNFSTILYDTILNTRFIELDVPNLNASYYWRTKAYVNGDSTNWSPSFLLHIFSPKNVGGTVLWLSSKNISLPNNTLLSFWEDFSSNLHHASQTSFGLRPLFKTNGGFRNNPYVDFTGSDGMLTAINNIDIPNDSTLGFVSLNINRNQGYGALFYLGNSGAYTPLYAGRTAGSSYNNGAMRFLGYNGSVFGFDIQTPNSTHKIITGINTATTAKLFSSGIQMASTTASVIPVASGATLKIGSNQDFQENYNGGVHELIVLKNTTDTSIYRKIERFIDCRYIPRANLGGNVFKYNGFCDSMITLSPGLGYVSYLWSTGATTPIINVNTFGNYSVTVTDEFGYVHYDQMAYRPNLFLRYPSTTLICGGDSILWDTQIPSNYDVVWSDGVLGSSRYVTTPGTLSYEIIDDYSCSYSSENRVFSIDNYPLTAALGNDTTLCSGNLISLQVGAPETVSYSWNNSSAGGQTQFFAVDTTGTYTIETTNVNGCVAKDTIAIFVSGTAPVADFYISNACLGTTTILEDESVSFGTDFIAQWTWNMGDGTVLTTQNGNYVYAAPGVYPVQLYVESTGGCGAFRWDTLEIFANPTAVFTSVGHCSGQDVAFASASYANGAPLSAHYWSFGMQPPNDPNNFSTLQEAIRNYLSAGSYHVSLVVTDTNSCTDEALATLVIDPTPIVQFAVDDACVGAEVQFTDESTTANFSTYLWNFGNNGTSLLTNPITSYASPGSRTVSLVVTSPVGCVGTGQGQLMVHANPVAVMDLGPYCKGTYTDVSDISTVLDGSIDSSYWIFNQMDTVYGLDVQYVFQTLGQQQVVLNTISNYGCKTTLSEFIEVTAELNAAFGVGTGITAAGAPFNFTNLSTGSAIYLWNFGDNTISNAVAPEHTYGEAYIDSTLQVALYALNVQGCVDTAYQSILIERAKIDLELSYLYVQKQNDWHIIGVKMTNRGTTPLKKIQLFLETDKGFLFQETWTGDLKPLEDTIYVFGAKPAASISDQNTEESFVCVQAIGYDLFQEEETILWNNYLCRNIEGENVILKPVYPNPVHGEMTVELIVSKDSEVSIQLFDATGRTAITLLPEQLLSEGNHMYKVNTAHLSSGTYFLRMVTKENVVMEKISFQ